MANGCHPGCGFRYYLGSDRAVCQANRDQCGPAQAGDPRRRQTAVQSATGATTLQRAGRAYKAAIHSHRSTRAMVCTPVGQSASAIRLDGVDRGRKGEGGRQGAECL
ncbi:MAG: hypothetical protein IBJ00_07700 [Alphaproteobacteria bacterium]|nr:hypothetical protein [Alphaproteobacteria bacterium]